MSDLYEEDTVFNTAKTTLHRLAQAGVTEAVTFEKALLGIVPEKSRADDEETEDPFDELNKLLLEMRYHMINREIALAGNRDILDLACGCTPRGKYLLDKGYRYVGGDLPEVVGIMNRLNEKLMGGKGVYLPIDVTNSMSVLAAAYKLDGPVTISGEGIMTYFDFDEKQAMWQCIRDVLTEHGGVWITSDFEMPLAYSAIGETMWGENIISEHWYDLPKKSLPVEEAERLLKEEGFAVKKRPFWSPDLYLTRLDGFSTDVREKLIAVLKEHNIWIVGMRNDPEGVFSRSGKNSEAAFYEDRIRSSAVLMRNIR